MKINQQLDFLKSINRYRYYIYLAAIFLLIIFIGTMIVIKPYRSNSKETPNSQRTESLDHLKPAVTSQGQVKVVSNIPIKQSAVFITIDDGWYINENVLKLMQQYHLPITTFLIEQAAQKNPDFWHEFVNAGGHIEDHTLNHPFLTHLPLQDEKSQISQPIDYFRQYGPPPDELRPPYGDYNSEVEQAAQASGIKYIVMWNAEMRNAKLCTMHNQELKPGDIILLHWLPNLNQELIQLLNILQKQNLGVADLTQALKGGPITISWLKSPLPVPKPLLATRVANPYKKVKAPRKKIYFVSTPQKK